MRICIPTGTADATGEKTRFQAKNGFFRSVVSFFSLGFLLRFPSEDQKNAREDDAAADPVAGRGGPGCHDEDRNQRDQWGTKGWPVPGGGCGGSRAAGSPNARAIGINIAPLHNISLGQPRRRNAKGSFAAHSGDPAASPAQPGAPLPADEAEQLAPSEEAAARARRRQVAMGPQRPCADVLCGSDGQAHSAALEARWVADRGEGAEHPQALAPEFCILVLLHLHVLLLFAPLEKHGCADTRGRGLQALIRKATT
jgi:hypothetical protein